MGQGHVWMDTEIAGEAGGVGGRIKSDIMIYFCLRKLEISRQAEIGSSQLTTIRSTCQGCRTDFDLKRSGRVVSPDRSPDNQ